MKAKVIMLPTDKATWPNLVWLGKISQQLRLDTSYNYAPKSCDPTDDSMLPQHIYLIDESAEIEEGDWYIDTKLFFTQTKEEAKDANYSPMKRGKVIVSTDKSLHNLSDVDRLEDFELPQLSEKSIKLLIDYYNKNGKMPDEVEVEEEQCDDYLDATVDMYGEDIGIELNPEGTVDIIIPEEKRYSKKEVEDILNKFEYYVRDHSEVNQLDEEEYEIVMNDEYNPQRWIEQNLK